ncbi:MAG TPA: type II toxin-antitoxin system RelE/ParE family toxin [Telluria sp.]|nr:type II toxin-antitoxin system RelE/ParE family toxin [Telluria sp.]
MPDWLYQPTTWKRNLEGAGWPAAGRLRAHNIRLVWTRRAVCDRHDIYDFIERHNPAAAALLDRKISLIADQLLRHPELGRPGRVAGTREFVVRHHYLLVYDASANLVRILRLLHTARNWPPA